MAAVGDQQDSFSRSEVHCQNDRRMKTIYSTTSQPQMSRNFSSFITDGNMRSGKEHPGLRECHLCPYKTHNSSHLTRHLLSHSDERPYACQYCSYRCRQKAHLQAHIRIHTGEKPYKCSYCEYRACDSSNLRKHEAKHH